MKQKAQIWKKVLMTAALAAVTASVVVAPGIVSASAVTSSEAATHTAVAPNSLNAMTRIGTNALANPNFFDGSAIPRDSYGGPWSFAHQDELGGAAVVGEYSSFQVVDVTDAVEGMGRTSGQGELVDKALEITINKDNQATAPDSLTYSQFDDTQYGDRATDSAWYFSAWIKAEQDMWFDVAISFGAAADHAQVLWDLGRRFYVEEGQWVQIGVDENGNYVPFRSKVLSDGFLRGTGAEPNASNSNSATADTYADESKGDTKIDPWYRSGWGNIWACLRIYAYSANTYGETGIGAPAATHGLTAGDKYLVAATNFWNYSSEAPVVAKPVETVTLDKTTASMEVGGELQLNATAAPADATDTSIFWSSSDEAIATVDETGKVTAVAAGTVTITAEANDGNGALATCEVTVTEPAEPEPGPEDSAPTNSAPTTSTSADSSSEGGCFSSIAGASVICTMLMAGGVMLFKKRRN